MDIKIKKLLFELTRNIRINTKEIGRRVGVSQQSASYLEKMLKRKRIIQNAATIADPAKMGLISVIVVFDYLNFDPQSLRDAIDLLKSVDGIVSIEETKHGADLIIEHAVPNLSAFNKAHSKIVSKLNKVLETKFIFPVIVKHEYVKNYLVRTFDPKDTILCGDREIAELSGSEKAVLSALLKKPESKFIDIAKNAKISTKTAVVLKKSLERKEVIRGYTCTLNNKKLGINRYLIFLKFSGEGIGEINKFKEFVKCNKNIVEMVKITGAYNVMVVGEETTSTEIIKEIRSMFSIDDYFLIRSENIIKKNYAPLDLF